MQEEKENMVDIDTSGPGADVELPEEKQEDVVETKEDCIKLNFFFSGGLYYTLDVLLKIHFFKSNFLLT